MVESYDRWRNGKKILADREMIDTIVAMTAEENSSVAEELVQRLFDLRVRLGVKDKDLAVKLGVKPTTLSKRLNDKRTVPDDEWIARLADAVELSPEDTAKLLLDAAIERAGRQKGRTSARLERALQRLRQNIYLPQSSLPRPKDDGAIIVQAFEATGIPIHGERSREEIVRRFASEHRLTNVPFASVLQLFDRVVGQRVEQLGSAPDFGTFSEVLRMKLLVRRFPLSDSALGAALGRVGRAADMRSLPLLPGILVHLINAPEGVDLPKHKHDGMEAILLMSGRMEIVFEDSLRVELNGDHPELLLYEASVQHGGKALSDASIIVVHYSQKLAGKWDIVERAYSQHVQQEQGANCEQSRATKK